MRVGLKDYLYFETDASKLYYKEASLTDINLDLEREAPNFPLPPQPICYRMLRCNFSDHRPVLAVYRFNVPYIVQERKKELKQIMNIKFEEYLKGSVPSLSIDVIPSNNSNENNENNSENSENSKADDSKKVSMKLMLKNSSTVWVNWSISEKSKKELLNIVPSSGRLFAYEDIELLVEWENKSKISNSLEFSINDYPPAIFKIPSVF